MRCAPANSGEALRTIPVGTAASMRRSLRVIEGAEADGVRPSGVCSETRVDPLASIFAGEAREAREQLGAHVAPGGIVASLREWAFDTG